MPMICMFNWLAGWRCIGKGIRGTKWKCATSVRVIRGVPARPEHENSQTSSSSRPSAEYNLASPILFHYLMGSQLNRILALKLSSYSSMHITGLRAVKFDHRCM